MPLIIKICIKMTWQCHSPSPPSLPHTRTRAFHITNRISLAVKKVQNQIFFYSFYCTLVKKESSGFNLSWNSFTRTSYFPFLNLSILTKSNSAELRVVVGEGNGTPLQYSCLENPMDRGAWWAAVHGITKSRTRLSDFTFTFHCHALEKEMATHSSVLAWRIPGTGDPSGLLSMGSHRVGHDWSDLAAAAAAAGLLWRLSEIMWST